MVSGDGIPQPSFIDAMLVHFGITKQSANEVRILRHRGQCSQKPTVAQSSLLDVGGQNVVGEHLKTAWSHIWHIYSKSHHMSRPKHTQLATQQHLAYGISLFIILIHSKTIIHIYIYI